MGYGADGESAAARNRQSACRGDWENACSCACAGGSQIGDSETDRACQKKCSAGDETSPHGGTCARSVDEEKYPRRARCNAAVCSPCADPGLYGRVACEKRKDLCRFRQLCPCGAYRDGAVPKKRESLHRRDQYEKIAAHHAEKKRFSRALFVCYNTLMTYRVQLEQFEGPLDLLLSLIEEQKLDITRVSMAKVTDQYLAYIQQKEGGISLENLTEFLSVAAKLVLIKSKALLPILELDEEEEGDIHQLEQQLAEFQKFKEAARRLGEIAQRDVHCFSREMFLGFSLPFHPPRNVSQQTIMEAFGAIVRSIPLIEKLEERLVKAGISVEEKIRDIRMIIHQRVVLSFADIVRTAKDRVDIIVSFLALLELVKQALISVEQKTSFSDITMRRSIQGDKKQAQSVS